VEEDIRSSVTTPASMTSDVIEVETEPLSRRLDPSHPGRMHQIILDRAQQMVRSSRQHIEQRFPEWDAVDKAMRLYVDLREGARWGDKRTDNQKVEMPFERSFKVPLLHASITTRGANIYSILNQRDPYLHYQPRESTDFRGARMYEIMSSYDMQQSFIALQTWQMVMSSEKYGFGAWYDTWEQDYGQIPSTAEELGIDPGLAMQLGIQTEDTYGLTKEWNNIRALDPHYILPDPAFPITDVQQMGYVGHTDFVNWIYLDKRRLDRGDGPYFNVDLVRMNMADSVVNNREYDARSVDGDYTADTHTRKYPVVALTRLQWTIIPADWGLSDSDRPEIWWFEFAGDRKFTLRYIVRAHKSPYAHNQYTYSFGQADFDNHAPFTPGMGQNLLGMQYATDWFVNSHVANARKMINDQVIYNDDLISRVDMNSPGPAKHIRLTRKGKGLHERGMMHIRDMYGQFEITDVTGQHLNTVSQFLPMAQRMAATPDTLQGMPLPTRRTLGEVEAVSNAASLRLGVAAQLLDEQVIRPMAERLVSNRQQFTSLEQAFRLTGRAAAEFGMQALLIRPDDLAGSYDYVVRTPTMPADPARNAALYGSILQILAQAPQLMNPGPDGRALDPRMIFEEFLKASGISHFDQFYLNAMPTGQMPGQVPPPQQGGAPNMGPGHVGGFNPQVMDNVALEEATRQGDMVAV
jgi:hypothetical protein